MRVRNLRASVAAIAFAAAVAGAGCSGGGQQPPPASAPPPDARRVDAATAGSLDGRVLFDGPAPQNPPIKMTADPVCIRGNPNGASFETFLVSGGGLDNVFVYVKDGLGNYYFDVPTEPVKLDQQGCYYRPHVFGVRVGQPIEITNSDPTIHNVHALPQANQEFNFPQQIQGMKNVKTFTARELMVPFKCDVHGWMRAYAGVLEHPYFAVTQNGGRFELKNLPPGTYTIEAWHERLGSQSQSVTLAEKETKAITFTYKTTAAS
jgi:plastocyanin